MVSASAQDAASVRGLVIFATTIDIVKEETEHINQHLIHFKSFGQCMGTVYVSASANNDILYIYDVSWMFCGENSILSDKATSA